MSDIAPVFAILGLMLGFVWLVRTVVTNRRRTQIARMQLDLQNKMVDKFAAAPELVRYLESEAGRAFLDSATDDRTNPYGRILGSAQAGIILTLTGIAFWSLQGRIGGGEGFVFLGTLGVALGVGFLLSATATYFLSKNWGLLDKRPST